MHKNIINCELLHYSELFIVHNFGTACDSGFGGCGSCTNIVDDVMVEGNECDACEEGYFFGEEGDTCDSTLNFVSHRQDFN